MGKQSGIGKDPDTGLYTAADTTWENIFAKKPRVKWCKSSQLEYEEQLHKIFDGRSASGEMAASLSSLQKNSTTSNQVFDPRLLTANVTAEGQENSESYLDRIDNEFGPLSDVEEILVESDTGLPARKKAKLSKKAIRKQGSPEHNPVDEMPSTSDRKGKKKSSVGFELAGQMKEWREERKLGRVNPEVEIIDKIKECYADRIQKLSFVEYGRLVSLLRESHLEFGGYTGAEYFRMMDDGDNPKFRDTLMEKWFESIKSTGHKTNTTPQDVD